jgi:hypothetical protein
MQFSLHNRLTSIFNTLAVLCLSSFAISAQSPINLLSNGSFETGPTRLGLKSLPGWTVTQGTVDVRSDVQQAPNSGTKCLELIGTPGVGGIQQSFPTDVDKWYMFVGYVSHHPGVQEAEANIFINGTQQPNRLSHKGTTSDSNLKWESFRYLFKADATTTTLKLVDRDVARYDNGGIFLDGLRVSPFSTGQKMTLNCGHS